MKKFLHHPVAALALRIVCIYIALFLLRVIFYLYNLSSLGGVNWSDLPDLFAGALKFDTANICYTFGIFIVWSLLPVSVGIAKRKWYRAVSMTLYIIGAVAICFFNLADSVYFHYAKKRATAEEFHFLNNSNTFTIMLRSLWENWYLVLLFAILLTALIYAYRYTKPQPQSPKNKLFYYSGKLIVLVAAVLLMIAGMRGGFSRAIRPITLSNAAQYAKSPAEASIVLSNPFCILRTVGNKKLEYIKYFSDSTLNKIYSPLHTPNDSTTMPLQKGKNVVIFVLESFSAEHSATLHPELYPNGSIMPFMDSLMTEGYYFKQAFANGSKSIDALPSILASIPSLGLPFATMPAALSPMDGIGSMLDSLGYSTWFYNGSESGSMGYAAYARLGGVQNFRSKENYEAARGTNDFDGYWGIWDEPFLQYFGSELTATPQPFFASLFTLTSHHPFVIPAQYASQFPEGRTPIHKCVSYVDLGFRRFFEYASRQAWYNNTLFVFVADHVSSERFNPATETTSEGSHIVYFLYTPDGSIKGSSNQITQQIDIKPTLLGLLNNKKPYHAFGRDVFSTQNSTPPFAVNFSGEHYQWIEGDTAYQFNKKQLTSAYNFHTDPLHKNDIKNNADTMSVNRLRAFLQSYHGAIEAQNFKYDQKK